MSTFVNEPRPVHRSGQPIWRRLLVLATLNTTAACTATPDRPERPADPTSDVSTAAVALADEYMAAWFERYPEMATYYGRTDLPHDRLTDPSLAALAAWQAREDDWLARLDTLDDDIAISDPAWPAVSLLREVLEASVGMRVCRAELLPVSHVEGWQVNVPYVIEIQPIGTPELERQALARIAALPAFIDTQTTIARAGLALGYSSPRHIVPLVLEQLEPLLDKASPLASPAHRSEDPDFRTRYLALLETEVYPAIRRQVEFLEREYRPSARRSIAVSDLPNGAACYRAAVRFYAGVTREAADIHAIGLAQIERIGDEMRQIAARSFDAMPVPDLIRRLTQQPEFAFETRDAVVAYATDAYRRADAAMPAWFGILPASEVVIEPYPPYREGTGTGEYNTPAEDGSRPGVFYIATKNPQSRPRAGQQSLTFHETIPGHHLQSAIAIERGARVHAIQRYTYQSGFGEGWALYAERLADEMGLYTSDLDRMGMLGDQGARAARLVIDTGLHVMGWTRAQSIDYLRAHTTWPDEDIEAEVDRYIAWPGQATSYMLGQIEILRLRSIAETALGEHFSIRDFHDRVLEDGNVSLGMLEPKIRAWVDGARRR